MSSQLLRNAQRSSRDPVTFVPAHVLIERGKEIHKLIERRAYEIYGRRGRAHGFDVDDWLWAESELLHPCRHNLKESPEAMVLQAELPGIFTVDQLEVSIEPRRLMVSGVREVEAIHGDSSGCHVQREAQRIFRVHDLPFTVDPSKTIASLKDECLEIVMPKAAVASKAAKQKKSALQSG
jgi:HSP20 family molecular chaperone IbpA